MIWGFDEGRREDLPVHRAEHDLDHRPERDQPGSRLPTGRRTFRQRCDQRLLGPCRPASRSTVATAAKPNAVVRDPGAVWLSGSIAGPAPRPARNWARTGSGPDCVDIDWPDPDPVVEITKVTVTKGNCHSRPEGKDQGQCHQLRDLAATPITIKLASSSKQVKVPGRVKLNVPAGKTATASITVTATKMPGARRRSPPVPSGKSGRPW